ncbi:type VI secretion system Vgr family protein [Rahnella woolbedingensis]|uniref:Type VI secretion system tip protein VgrG n=1 Tax=Rahnella woolbedingensis TaxID=1510574 RepID=A0A419N232_9GAMM|nr:type VI secretion system tip protein TssI/VgrG [Rahnella woolbedingensis]RJT32776.1 type VI secretion system tip protein VgrG [Rahnella woolbedingensis]
MAVNGTRFTFAAGSVSRETFAVVSFHLSQAYSELFTLNITLASSDPAIGFEKIVDEMATLTLWQGDEIKRRVRGIVTFCEQGDTGKHQTLYRLIVRPFFWRSSQRRNCRSFQNLNIEGILEPLLREMGIFKYETLFRAAHDWREFCVQFMESDYEFISRLMAEEGIFFFEEEFLKANDQKLTFADNCTTTTNMGALPYNPNAASEAATYCINHFRRSVQIRPSKVITQDYTFTAPNWPAQYQDRPSKMAYQHAVYDVYDYPGRFKDEQHGEDFAKYQIEGWRNNADFVVGSSNSPQLQPSVSFNLTDHPRDDLNAQWQVVAVDIYGDQPQAVIGNEGQGTTLHTDFQAIPSTQTWRPTPLPKPRIDGPQIAIVTGPPGEEIFCDEHGRVRVKFAWDRYNKADSYSSCWIRVSQAWAGTGFGNIAIPRVGQEVIVDFLNGDPDQPIITGRTYHASNRAPGDLPGTKTQMAIRSQTYKGSGYNELLFEDATRQELLSLHAQKDMQVKVLNSKDVRVNYDRTVSIGHDESLVVANDRKITVEGKQDHKTTKDFVSLTEGNQHLEVKGDLAEKIAGALGISVKGDIVLQSNSKISLCVGSSFIGIHSAGVDIKGVKINLNSGGSPGEVILPMRPMILKAAAGEGSVFVSHCPMGDK